MTKKRHYICTFLKPNNTYSMELIDIDPAEFIIMRGNGEIWSLLNVLEITEEQALKLAEIWGRYK